MPRLIRLTATGPVKIEPPLEKPVWICACGLSQTFPICDGSHKGCNATESDGHTLYVYDDARKNIIETRPVAGPQPDLRPVPPGESPAG